MRRSYPSEVIEKMKPKSTVSHPWRKRNDSLLKKYSIKYLRKEGVIRELKNNYGASK
jgi:hypothetical protein